MVNDTFNQNIIIILSGLPKFSSSMPQERFVRINYCYYVPPKKARHYLDIDRSSYMRHIAMHILLIIIDEFSDPSGYYYQSHPSSYCRMQQPPVDSSGGVFN